VITQKAAPLRYWINVMHEGNITHATDQHQEHQEQHGRQRFAGVCVAVQECFTQPVAYNR